MIYFQCNKGRIHIEKTCQLLILHFEHLETERDFLPPASSSFLSWSSIFVNILWYSLISKYHIFDILVLTMIFEKVTLAVLTWRPTLSCHISKSQKRSQCHHHPHYYNNVIIICFITISRGGDVQGTNVRGSLYPGVYAVFVI